MWGVLQPPFWLRWPYGIFPRRCQVDEMSTRWCVICQCLRHMFEFDKLEAPEMTASNSPASPYHDECFFFPETLWKRVNKAAASVTLERLSQCGWVRVLLGNRCQSSQWSYNILIPALATPTGSHMDTRVAVNTWTRCLKAIGFSHFSVQAFRVKHLLYQCIMSFIFCVLCANVEEWMVVFFFF